MKSVKSSAFSFILMMFLVVLGGCGTVTDMTGNDPNQPNDPGPNDPNDPNDPGNLEPAPQVVLTPVGPSISAGLIDLEFLPGQNGEAIAITQSGSIYYLDADFNVVGSPESITVEQDGGEQGLLGIVADPGYQDNNLIYLYYTVPGMNPDRNTVERYRVNVDLNGNSFSLEDGQVIIFFDKTTAATNHNGGSMVFMSQDELAIGVGDGGIPSNDPDNPAQDLGSRLGKINRIIPNRTMGIGGYSDPGNNVPGALDSIYSLGLRNPFTLVVDAPTSTGTADLFVGDVGANSFEEINCVYYAGENYFWPECEGPCPQHDIINPIHGYAHNDSGFDPDFNIAGPKSIILSAFYLGNQYGGAFTNKIIYNEFFDGFVRLLTMTQYEQVIADEHIGNQPGLTGLHENPADGLLYGVSLFGPDRILRLDLAP